MRTLAALEIALTVVVLTAMGLVARSFVRLAESPRGYETRDVVVAGCILPRRAYPNVEARRTFVFRLLEELRREPILSSPAVSSGLPAAGGTTAQAWDGDADLRTRVPAYRFGTWQANIFGLLESR
jgi:hypothetical protein